MGQKNNIAIVMSVYNPNHAFLQEQLNSLLNQEVLADIYIRDDGSTSTKHFDLLEEYSKNKNVFIFLSNNVGVIKSFLEILKIASLKSYEYIGFSDQDDVALPDKTKRAVNMLSRQDSRIPTLYFSQMSYTNNKLKVLGKPYINNKVLGFKNALIESSVNGNLIFLNQSAVQLVLSKKTDVFKMHDWWIYMCVAAFGKIIYDDKVTLLYRQHESNVVGGAVSSYQLLKNRMNRLRYSKNSFRQISVQAFEFKSLFGDALPCKSRRTLDKLLKTKTGFFYRLKYAFSIGNFDRMKRMDNFLFRLLIILNLY